MIYLDKCSTLHWPKLMIILLIFKQINTKFKRQNNSNVILVSVRLAGTKPRSLLNNICERCILLVQIQIFSRKLSNDLPSPITIYVWPTQQIHKCCLIILKLYYGKTIILRILWNKVIFNCFHLVFTNLTTIYIFLQNNVQSTTFYWNRFFAIEWKILQWWSIN